MKIPMGFREAIADAFYDKKIALYAYKDEATEGFGTRRVPSEEPLTSVLGNWQDITNAEKAREYGMLPGGGAVFTCGAVPADIASGCFARSPAGQMYRIIDVLRRDSHCKVVCEVHA